MPEKYALVIGIENYQDTRISSVQFAEDDATEIADSLKLHGFQDQNMDTLLSLSATKATIESRLRKYAGIVNYEDTLVLFYAGHGFTENHRNYITCYDSQIDDLRNTCISLTTVFSFIRTSNCKRFVLFIDSCHSGLEIDESMRGIFSDMSEEELREFFKNSEFQVGFASCKSDQYSYSSHHVSHGIWSYHIIEALKGNVENILEKGRYLTANSLQAYLSKEVPRTLRKSLTVSAVQTPCMFGNITKDFLIADLDAILEAKRVQATPHLAQLKRVLFSGETTGRIKSLRGFSKWHTVPDEINSATENFVAKVGSKEIEEKSEILYQELKKLFAYKRKDIELDIRSGSASLICKDFDIDLSISINPADPSEYRITIEATNFRNPQIVETPEFNQVFRDTFQKLVFKFDRPIEIVNLIDIVEQLDDDKISVAYTSDYSACTINLGGFNAEVIVTQDSFEIQYHMAVQPIKLVETFFEAQKLLANKPIVKLLPFAVSQET